MCYLQIIIIIIIIIINFVPYTLLNHFLNKHLGMRLFGKKKTFPLIPRRPLIANIQTFLKAFYPKRHPVQDAKFWNYIPCLRLKTLKTITCSAAHTRQGQIIFLAPINFKRVLRRLVQNIFQLTYQTHMVELEILPQPTQSAKGEQVSHWY